MSDTDIYDDDAESGSTTVTLSRAQIRALEKKAKERDVLAERLERLERQQVFAEAGIDQADPKAKYFVKGYDGEMTADAIRKAATEAGFIQAPEPSAEQIETLDAGQRIVAASAGATPQSAVSEATLLAEMEKAAATGGKDAIMAVARRYGAVSTEDYS